MIRPGKNDITMYKDSRQKIVAIIEARMTSSRLPGKVVMPLAGKPAVGWIIERLKRSRYVDEVIVATTTNKTDDALVEAARNLKAKSFRGSEDDVLARVLGAAHETKADVIVEITGDCPLVDHRLVDRAIELLSEKKADFVSNNTSATPTFPDGFDVRVFPTAVLEQVDRLTKDPIDRVHVSYYIWTHPDKFKVVEWKAPPEMHGPDLRVTLDERNDYELLDAIFKKLLPKDEDFSAADVVALLRGDPSLRSMNQEVKAKTPEQG